MSCYHPQKFRLNTPAQLFQNYPLSPPCTILSLTPNHLLYSYLQICMPLLSLFPNRPNFPRPVSLLPNPSLFLNDHLFPWPPHEVIYSDKNTHQIETEQYQNLLYPGPPQLQKPNIPDLSLAQPRQLESTRIFRPVLMT